MSPARRLAGRAGALWTRASDSGLAAAAFAPAVAAGITLWLVIPTLLPGVSSWDTAEFQAAPPVLGTAHPTGYPAYVILGWITSHVLPFGDPAYRMNLLQAILAAAAVAGTTALVQQLTGMRWLAVATGLLLAWTKLFWQLSMHADPHMFHLALVAILFVLLIAWDRRRIGKTETPYVAARWILAGTLIYAAAVADHRLPLLLPLGFGLELWAALFVVMIVWEALARRVDEARAETDAQAGSEAPTSGPARTAGVGDRWLVAAAFVYGVAVANHSLALLLPPAIGLFVLAVDWRIVMRWRTVLACAAVLAGTIVALFMELPIRAAMHAPLVYGRPDTWDGFTYVVLAEQFRGSLIDPLGDLAFKAGHAVDLISGLLGPFGYLAVVGLATSIIRRPRFVLLSGLSVIVACVFAESYDNAWIARYYLVPLFVAFTWVGLGAADIVAFSAWMAARVGATAQGVDEKWRRQVMAWLEVMAAVVLVASVVGIVPERQRVNSDLHPEGVSEAGQTYWETWMHSVLAPADKGGLPENAVIVSWWSTSTTLWYGQRVEGLRPDIYIVDDRTRLDDNLGEVWDVFDRFLGKRPVFTMRMDGGIDGLIALQHRYVMTPYRLPNDLYIQQVVEKRGSQ